MKVSGVSVFTQEHIEIEINQGKISTIRLLPESDQTLPYVSPGFFDLQVNGYMGIDYSADSISDDQVKKMISNLAVSGITQHIPTIISSPEDKILKNLRSISHAINDCPEIEQAIPGIHIEGPFISLQDGPRGCHDSEFIRDPDFEEFLKWQEAAEGRIKMVTLAPEKTGAIEFIKKAVNSGVIIGLGHTGASPEKIREAISAGAQYATHLGNASFPSVPKVNNYIWEQLAADKLFAGIISDGFHLPGSAVKIMARAKGMDKLVLTSDVALLGGLQPGVYKWGEMPVEVFKDGHLGLSGTDHPVGAGYLLDWDIAHFIQFTGHRLMEAISLCTINPAKLMTMPPDYGKIEVGAPANLTLFYYHSGDSRLRIVRTLCGGKVVY